MQPLNRRRFLQVAGASAAALAFAPFGALAQTFSPGLQTLPKLPYDYDALQPAISAEIMTLHHDKHHQAYITNYNNAIKDYPDLLKKTPVELLMNLKEVPEKIRTVVNNHGGGHVNHTLFWTVMASPGKGGEPSKELTAALDSAFGSVDKFKMAMTDAATKVFGSGWAWLVKDSSKKVKLVSTPNQNSTLLEGMTPLLGIDVWEHAYYLQYKQARPEYIKAWWTVVNWKQVNELFGA